MKQSGRGLSNLLVVLACIITTSVQAEMITPITFATIYDFESLNYADLNGQDEWVTTAGTAGSDDVKNNSDLTPTRHSQSLQQ